MEWGHPGKRAPPRAWTSKSGLAEATRRIDAWMEKHGRLPTITELKRSDLNLGSFFNANSNRFGGLEGIYSKLGYTTPQEYRSQIRELPRDADTQKRQAELQTAVDALAVIEQVISRIDSIKFSETGSGLSRGSVGWSPAGRIEAYGISCQTPQDFWYTKKGWIEAARRIREYRHTTGAAPSSSEVMVTLGLGGFVKAYERYGYRYDFIMNTISQLTVKIDALIDSRRAQQQP